MTRNFILILLLATSAWAGQSLASGTATRNSFPERAKTLPYRIEFYIHDWLPTHPSVSRPFRVNAFGFQAYFTSTFLILENLWDTGGSNCTIPLASFPSGRMYVRYQRDPETQQRHCEAWDENGIRIVAASSKATGVSNFSSSGADSSAAGAKVGFARIHSSLVALNSRPPVHRDDNDRLLEWKFDGNLSDSSGNNYNGSGSVSYTETPNQTTFSLPRVQSTTWSNWTAMRAGHQNQISGSSSYSQTDDSAAVSCSWRVASWPAGAPPPVLGNASECDTTIDGLVFGGYTLELTADNNGINSTKAIDVGAVATDDRGVVIHANPDVEKIFGPMIALGRNPWAYADDAHLRGMTLRTKTYDTFSPPEWKQYLPGTLDGNLRTTLVYARLSAAITPTSMEIPVVSVAELSLSSLPTIISFGQPGYGGEEVRVCSVNGNTLNVCYDGRGWRNSNPRSWGVNQAIFQRRLVGTGTQFLTDLCPGGVGMEGPVRYSSGTVNVTPGSNIITGNSTAWTSANGVFVFLWVRVEATHGGEPFVFFSPITAINNAGQITMTRQYPADADAGSFSYKLIHAAFNSLAPVWKRSDNTEGQTILGISACLSDTELYWSGGYEAVNGVSEQSNYGVIRSFWMTSAGNGSPNFYDEVLANYALYFRSGYRPALEAARKIGDYWLTQPLLDEGWASNFPRNLSVAGTVAGAVLDGRTQNWYALRRLANTGVFAISASCNADVRENGYQLMWLAFAAMFDPLDTGNPTEPGQRSYWRAKLADSYNRDNNCKGADNSFASGSYYAFGATGNMVNGSTEVTGTGFTESLCKSTGNGTGNITEGLDTLTANGVIPPGPNYIIITGTRQGAVYSAKFQYLGAGATVRLNALWPGDSGEISWQTETDNFLSSWSTTDTNDPQFGQIYGCRFNSSTSLTLNRPWQGATGTARYFRNNLLGKGQQPFIAGIKALQMKFASLGAEGETASNYAALATQLANWIRDYGYDPATGGLHYGRGFNMCEPQLTASRPGFLFRNVGCNYGTGSDGKGSARALLAETQNAARLVYEAEPTAANREWGDTAYANLWGHPGFTDPSVPLWEGNVGNFFASDQSLNAGKWYGFQFGVGMAHQWPAVRLGGAQPPVLEDQVIDYDASAFPDATAVWVTILRPSGETVTTICGTGNCTVQVDRRQGEHWYQLNYRNAGGETIAEGQWQLLRKP